MVLLASTLLSLACVEVGLRFLAHRANEENFESAFSTPRPVRQGGRTALVDILQPSANEKIVYELRPNLSGLQFKGRPLSTNSFGFRSSEVAVEKQPGEVVIVGIGDSTMFGHGVGDGEPYLSVLEDLLRRKHPDRSWKVINSGVPGYNTVMEVETLRTKLLQFQPDVVVLDLVVNDLELPVYLRATQDVLDLGRSFLFDFVVQRFDAGRSSREPLHGSAGLVGTPSDLETVTEPSQADLSGFSEQYREMIGIDAYRRAIDELAELSREHGFRVVVWSLGEFADPVPQLLREARERGFGSLSILEEMRAHVEGKYHFPLSTERQDQTDLAVGPGNAHPSVLLHLIAARKLLRYLEESGSIETSLEGNAKR